MRFTPVLAAETISESNMLLFDVVYDVSSHEWRAEGADQKTDTITTFSNGSCGLRELD
jgi:hypothetical protein